MDREITEKKGGAKEGASEIFLVTKKRVTVTTRWILAKTNKTKKRSGREGGGKVENRPN